VPATLAGEGVVVEEDEPPQATVLISIAAAQKFLDIDKPSTA
jgi:hypothetical protein